jgi:hypothetical protein
MTPIGKTSRSSRPSSRRSNRASASRVGRSRPRTWALRRERMSLPQLLKCEQDAAPDHIARRAAVALACSLEDIALFDRQAKAQALWSAGRGSLLALFQPAGGPASGRDARFRAGRPR